MILIAALGIVIGAIAQRVAGLGFALVVAPLFVITFGPYDGVLLINFGGTLSSIFVLTRLWKDVNWRRYFQIGPAALLVIVPTSFLVVRYTGSVLQVIIGLILLAGLSHSLATRAGQEFVPRWWVSAAAGAAAGITSATAGIGAPALSIYAVKIGWNQREFAATLQPIFVTTGAASFISKILIAGGPPDIDWRIWVGMVALGGFGMALGERVKRHVSAPTARKVALILCYAGALVATIDAVADLAVPNPDNSGRP